jgi:anaerobic magnesium-protoporphyrin IX monomethyl ester cyclase
MTFSLGIKHPLVIVILGKRHLRVERGVFLTTHSYYLNRDAKQLARMNPYSPLSTLIASAMLRDRGHAVAHFDPTLAEGIASFETALESIKPSVVAILEDSFNFLTKMCTVRRREDALAMIAAAKRRGCSVLVNGPDAQDHPEGYLRAGADAVLLGEGEAALVEIADLWRDKPGARLDEISGLVLPMRNGKAHRTRPRGPQRNLDELPFPAWELVDVESYRRAWKSRHGYFSWNMATSRGCPYACNWCAKPTFGRGYEQRSPKSVASELRRLKETIAPDHVWFADDIFGMTPDWLRAFAAEVERLDARIPFMMQSRVNLMRREAVEALARAGAAEVWLGVESGSQKILDAMEKGSRVHEARSATRELKAHGIRTCWFIQLGYPGETWEDLCLTRDLILGEMPDDIGVSVAYPLPGTRFYDLVRAQLGEQQNWRDSDDLAMLFEGTYNTDFYRAVRDVLHDEVRSTGRSDVRWAHLARDGAKHRSANPMMFAAGS